MRVKSPSLVVCIARRMERGDRLLQGQAKGLTWDGDVCQDAPMRLAVLTDTHGNLPALDAALAFIHDDGCDAIYHTGDAVGIGPYPAECVERLRAVGARCVMGNHEAYCLDLLPHDGASGMSAGEVAHHAWVRAALGTALREVVARWPWRLEEQCNGARVAFMHYALDDSGRDFAPFVPHPDAWTLDPLFARYRADLVFYGHNHAASDVRGQGRYINPGSLGCCEEPVARFITLDIGDDDSAYTLVKHAIPYDDAALLQAFDERGVPDRDFIRRAFFTR